MDHNKLWKILKEMGIPDHLTCLLRNVYVNQAAAELDMEQLTGSKWVKEYKATYIVTLIINLYAEYIMQNAELDESQTGIKTSGRNINNLRFVNDTTLVEDSE